MDLVELKINDHRQSLMTTLRILSKTRTLTQICLVANADNAGVTNNCSLAVHQEIFSGLLERFNDQFLKESQTHYYFLFDNVQRQILNKAVDFMYSGNIDMVNEELNEFYKVLDILQLNETQYSSICDPDLNTRFTLTYYDEYLTNLWYSRTELVCDVLFITSDFLKLNAHSLIISGNSNYMLSIFLKHKARRKPFTFILQNVKREDLESVVEFCYKGSVCVLENRLKEVFEAARLLGVDALCEKILGLDPSVTTGNVPAFRTDISSSIKTALSSKLDDQSKRCMQMFTKIMDHEQLCDISLVVGNNIYRLHLAVLIEYSPFFLNFVTKCNSLKDSFVLIKDLNNNHTQSFIDYIYNGETEFLGSTKDFCPIMKDWINFEMLPVCESKECQILSPSITRTDAERRDQGTPQSEHLANISTEISCLAESKSRAICENIPKKSANAESLAEVGEVDTSCSIIPDGTEVNNQHTRQTRLKKCHTCAMEFKSYKLLKEHTEIHPEARIMKCEFCGKKFDRESQLNIHLRTHTGARPFSCSDCGITFTAKSTAAQHKFTHNYDRSRLFVCDICKKTFSRKQYMEEHIRSHTGSKPYQCTICNKTFVGRTGLNHHTKTHDRNPESVCEVCGKSFTRHALWTHMKQHDKTYKCTHCDKFYPTNAALNIHVASAHSGERNHQCEVCGKGFVQKTHLDRHSKVHQLAVKIANQVAFSCEKCTKGFKSETKLQSHVRREHSEPGDKPYSCGICHKSFAAKSTAIYHRRGHTGEQPFSCHACGKGFARPDTYRKHLRLHDRDPRPTKSRKTATTPNFECHLCYNKYCSKSALHKHMRKMHLAQLDPETIKIQQDDDDLVCATCNKTFKTAVQCNAHTRSHDNASKKFACEICDRSFRSESVLTKHLDIHTMSASPAPELPPIYTFQQCSEPPYSTSYVNEGFINNSVGNIEMHDQYPNIDDHENNMFIDDKSSECTRRSYSINIDGNLCCDDVEDKLICLHGGSTNSSVEPTMLTQDNSIELHRLHEMNHITSIDSKSCDIETTPLTGMLADTIGGMMSVENSAGIDLL